ncbi:G-protein_alpha subunit [Hexamita inflata]|uniref:G-protein alpha subunit n=1 Tax=Hexamita inflata TaxID=28002 RepID=A0AA86UXN2_9EUKA|nr:G-protein alpha subunit [Hexamita inflata]
MNEKVLTSQALDKKLEQINHDQKRTTKVLVVGAQNSGKQTLMKQLRVFYDGSLLDFDLLKLRNKQDITQNMRSLVALMLNKGYLLPTDLVQQLFTDQSTCPKHILLQLSADPQIKLFMEQNSIPQNAKHSIMNTSRLLMMEQHDPFDLNDYLNSNIPLYTVKFNLNKNNYVFINNGSNLSYKWAELFRDVSGIVFVLDICTCFQRDSDGKSQVLTQLQEFDQTINQEYFKNSPIILLLIILYLIVYYQCCLRILNIKLIHQYIILSQLQLNTELIPIQIPDQKQTQLLQAISDQTGSFTNEQDYKNLLPQLSLFEDEEFVRQHVNSKIATKQHVSSFNTVVEKDNFVEKFGLTDSYKKAQAHEIFNTVENRSYNICNNVSRLQRYRKNVIEPVPPKSKQMSKRCASPTLDMRPGLLRLNVCAYVRKFE